MYYLLAFKQISNHGCYGDKASLFQVFKETAISGFNTSDYSVEQVFYPSKDGTKIPMFIAYRKDFVKDGSQPCMLYGYGGFNISLTP